VVLNIVVSFALMQVLGVGGLALGTTIALTVNMLVLIQLLRKKIGPMGFGRLVTSLGRIAAATAVMGVVVFTLDHELSAILPSGNGSQALRVGLGVVGGTLVYFAAAAIGGLPELREVRAMLRQALSRQENAAGRRT
jgi:putative peptidoglycan lipid II flippase